MALYVLGYWVGNHFYSMVPLFSTVYFVFSQIWINIFTGCSLCQDTISTYKLSIYVKNMETKFHEIQGLVTYFFNLM